MNLKNTALLLSTFLMFSTNVLSAPTLPMDKCRTATNAEEEVNEIEQTLVEKVRFTNAPVRKFSISKRMEHHKVAAMSVTLIKDNELHWSRAYGQLSTTAKTPANCGSLFQAASISKPVAMMAILRMAEQGKLNLNDNIQGYLTSYSLPQGKQSATKPVTFDNLLRHTSGISPGGYLGYSQGQPLPTDAEILRGIKNSNSQAIAVVNSPNEVLRYSGGGYTLAELAVQDIFQQPFEDIMANWLLKPVAMTNSDFSQPISQSKHNRIALAHDNLGTPIKGGWHNHPEQAAAGLWSTPTDLAKFLIEISKGYRGQSQVFSKSLINQLLANQFARHAYGFRLLGEEDNLTLVHHGGNVGYRSTMLINLKSGDGIAVLTNSDNGSALIGEFLRAVSSTYNWPHYQQTELTQKKVTQQELAKFAGTYRFKQQGWQVNVLFENKHLFIQFPNDDRYKLTSTTKGVYHFVHATTGVEATFSNENGNWKIFLYGQDGYRTN